MTTLDTWTPGHRILYVFLFLEGGPSPAHAYARRYPWYPEHPDFLAKGIHRRYPWYPWGIQKASVASDSVETHTPKMGKDFAMTDDLVPFGKYKGQPVPTLLADQEYCEWLRAQPWLASRFTNIYNILINYGGEVEDSPEHNALQARFLDEAFCLKFAQTISPQWFDSSAIIEGFKRSYGDRYAEIVSQDKTCYNVEFEVTGWDVVLELEHSVWMTYEVGGGNMTETRYSRHFCMHVECKPSMGDDYPSVLRQMKGYRRSSQTTIGKAAIVLLVDQYDFRGVSLDQVKGIFNASKIKLVLLHEILQ